MQKQKRSFTLIELLIVLIIIGVMVTLALPQLEGLTIRMKMAELYNTVNAIIKAEEIFYMEMGFYAEVNPRVPEQYWLRSFGTQEDIDNFKRILGIDIPGMNSVFFYGAFFDGRNSYISVTVRNIDYPVDLCLICYAGPAKGKWFINEDHPWARYIQPPADYEYFLYCPTP